MSNTPKPQANGLDEILDWQTHFVIRESVTQELDNLKITQEMIDTAKAKAKQEIQALITQARNEGMALTELDRFDGLDERQIKILIDYHQSSLEQLKEKL